MMNTLKVRLLTAIVGHGFHHSVGEIIELPHGEAVRFIERKMAEAIAPETATVAPPLRATRTEPRKKTANRKPKK